MSQQAYDWKPGSRLGANPQAVGERLETLRLENDGFLTPGLIVADATARKSPLHGCFEWDDAVAAEAHRLNQARYVMRQIVVTVNIVDREPAVVRAFVSVTPDDSEEDDGETAYTSVQHALREPRLREQVVHRARMEFVALRRKYSELQELGDVFAAIDRAAGEP